MARPHATDISGMDMKWHVLRMLLPYLLEFRGRTALAFVCLALAKLATISLPFFLKYIVDGLDSQVSPDAANAAVPTLAIVPVALILAYGTARFMNVIFNELRDTLFGRVTER